LGIEPNGSVFNEDARTLTLSRKGAAIALHRKFTPQQEITLRNRENGCEARARVVGQMGNEGNSLVYGISFLDPGIDLWGIEFPPLTGDEKPVARTLLECGNCRNREVVHLDEFEADVYQFNQHLARRCRYCGTDTVWKQAGEGSPDDWRLPISSLEEELPKRVPPKLRIANERKHLRVGIQFLACIRYMGSEEVVRTENVSRGGFAFKSRRPYYIGASVEVAVPYSVGAGNIFGSASIVNARELPQEGSTLYGIQYQKSTGAGFRH
jgi:hypothetical protein